MTEVTIDMVTESIETIRKREINGNWFVSGVRFANIDKYTESPMKTEIAKHFG